MAEKLVSTGSLRPAPEAWTGLINVAQTEMARTGLDYPTDSVIGEVNEAVAAIGNELFDEARYFGIILVMCGFAKRLERPGVRQDIVNGVAGNLLRPLQRDGGYSVSKLYLGNIESSDRMNRAFTALAQDASGDLTAGERLVADILDADKPRRVLEIIYPAYRHPPKTKIDADKIRSGTLTAQRVSSNATSAATTVIRVAAEKLFASDTPEDSDTPITAYRALVPTLEFLSEPEMALVSLARRCALLREDEFLKSVQDHVGVDDQGNLTFGRMVPSRELESPQLFYNGKTPRVVLHKKRLKCPAVFIDGLIEMMLGVINDAAHVAQSDLETQIQMHRFMRARIGRSSTP